MHAVHVLDRPRVAVVRSRYVLVPVESIYIYIYINKYYHIRLHVSIDGRGCLLSTRRGTLMGVAGPRFRVSAMPVEAVFIPRTLRTVVGMGQLDQQRGQARDQESNPQPACQPRWLSVAVQLRSRDRGTC